MWFEESNMYFCKIENFTDGETNKRGFSHPPPQDQFLDYIALQPIPCGCLVRVIGLWEIASIQLASIFLLWMEPIMEPIASIFLLKIKIHFNNDTF